MADAQSMTGDELSKSEAILSIKMREGKATPDEIKQFNQISRRMGNVNISLDRQRHLIAGPSGYSQQQILQRRRRRKKNIKKNKGKKK